MKKLHLTSTLLAALLLSSACADTDFGPAGSDVWETEDSDDDQKDEPGQEGGSSGDDGSEPGDENEEEPSPLAEGMAEPYLELPAAVFADLDGDGVEDLVHQQACGTLGVTWGELDAPLLGDRADVLIEGDVLGVPGDACQFGTGSALSAVDLDGDGREELFVGVPGMGTVARVSGADRELQLVEILGSGDGGFGESIVRGDFDGDGHRDLAIGAPEAEVYGQAEAGKVWVYFGGTSGIIRPPVQFDDGPLANTGARFGAALASGRIDMSVRDALAIGAPGDSGQGVAEAGSVTVVFGDSLGFGPGTIRQRFMQGMDGFPDLAEAGDAMGVALQISAGQLRIIFENETLEDAVPYGAVATLYCQDESCDPGGGEMHIANPGPKYVIDCAGYGNFWICQCSVTKEHPNACPNKWSAGCSKIDGEIVCDDDKSGNG